MDKEKTERGEMVQHPSHYNNHPLGIECIDIIRHYTCDVANAIKYLWRAGLKQEAGLQEQVKEIEDLKKAIWYIEDLKEHKDPSQRGLECGIIQMCALIKKDTGHEVDEITSGYEPSVAFAMTNLLYCGLVSNGVLCRVHDVNSCLYIATKCIEDRIKELEGEGEE